MSLSKTGSQADIGYTSDVKARERAFTLIELLVVVAIIAILAAVLLPVLRSAQVRGETAACIANHSQLAKAWVMYASDNYDYTPGNSWADEANWDTHTNENWVSGWEDPTGTSPNSASPGDSDGTNTTLLTSPVYSTIAAYTSRQPGLFGCPANLVMVKNYPASKLVRTISMNSWIGFNQINVTGFAGFKVYTRTTMMTAGLGPADIFVFIEERGESIDDGFFEVGPPAQGATIVYNMPSGNHNGAGVLSFADGHVEDHRWLGLGPGWTVSYGNPPNANIITPQQAMCPKWASPIGTVAGNNPGDLGWLELHATCHQ